MAAPTLSSPPLGPEQARELVLALERSGIDTGRIHVDTAAPLSSATTSRIDRQALSRPGARVAAGMVGGLVVGSIIGLVAAALVDVSTGIVVVAMAVGATVLGGLIGLYSQLPTSSEVSDTDGGHPTSIRVDVSGLAAEDVEAVRSQLQAA